MKVLLSWLREFAPDIDGDPVELGETLSALGLAVEEMHVLGDLPDSIVVARVVALRPHPDADRIQLVDVDAGDGTIRQVCCGAFNMKEGDLIPLATVGTVMPGGLEIRERKLRGQISSGMCCSAAELELADDADGILILPPHLADRLGEPVREALGLERDVLYDLEVNANRPDALSVAGVARDLAAGLGVPFELPEPDVTESGGPVHDMARVEILDPVLCGRFVARVLTDIRVGTSPAWLARRLTLTGMRPINSVVDVSNYVMLELGQPNHTYDLAKVAGPALRIRRAREGERLVTLDGVERVLAAADGVIADGDDVAIGIAGVMGGASTEIDDTTSNVLLEMAWWDPPSISRTVKRLNLPSEASMRFRRGADWGENIDRACRRFAELLAPGGARLVAGQIDERGELPDRGPIRVRPARVNGLLGTELGAEQMAALLAPIGFDARRRGDELAVTLPTWRWDATTEIDVVEEIARLHGYERLPRTVPRPAQVGGLSDYQRDRRLVREVLVGAGCHETQPMPFLGPGDLAAAGLPEDAIALSNPLDATESLLRTSLLPGQLRIVAYNQSHRNDDLRFFEIGHVFGPPPEGQILPDEREHLAVTLAGEEAPRAVAVVRLLTEVLALPNVQLRAAELAGLHPTRAAEVVVAGRVRGAVGEVDPVVCERFGVEGRVAWLELDLGEILSGPHGRRRYRPVSKYPSADIDLAFEVPEAVPAAAVEATLRKAGGERLVRLELFDVYRGPGLAEGTRSLAFRLRLQAPDHTLTDAEIAEIREACIAAVEKAHGARLRA
ncbi:MAG: phenylalanine--tRNA ligase subunit beta [Actinomyces sp.]|nr:MAG: phenylalanine--tRNA ligase subunit beta [Actinomyces sp.]